MIKVVLCDVGGVLVCANQALTSARLTKLGVSPDKADLYFGRADYIRLARGEINQQQYWDLLRIGWQVDISENDLRTAHTCHITGLRQDVYEIILNIGIPVYLVTNTIPVEFDRYLELFRADEVAMAVWRSDEEHCLKADYGVCQAIVDKWLRKQGHDVVPAEVLFVDDSPGNISAANGSGIHGHRFEDTPRLEGFLRSFGL